MSSSSEVQTKSPEISPRTLFAMDSWLATSLSFALFVLSWFLVQDAGFACAVEFAAIFGFHELGHWSAARALHVDAHRPLFLPLLGGFVILRDEEISENAKLLIVLSGPLAGFAAADIVVCLGHIYFNPSALAAGMVGIIAHLLNLLPLPGLDGGHLVRGFAPWSYVVGIGAIATWVFFHPSNVGVWVTVALLGVLVGFQTWAAGKQAWRDPDRHPEARDVISALVVVTLWCFHGLLVLALSPLFAHWIWTSGL